RQEPARNCRTQTAARQAAPEIRRITAVHHLRPATLRSTSSAVCPTQSFKVSDEFTVPLCRGHHRQLHQAGDERAWWEGQRVNALEIARGLWEQTHPAINPVPLEQHPL
ncbi:MAG: hypothetical protein WB839_08740, partial [Pseudolabrys sp.]